MNKNKKEYVDSINKIQASDELQRKTLNKMKETNKKGYRKIYAYASAAIVFVLILSIALPIGRNMNEIDPAKIIAEHGGLPRVESFENLQEILKVDDQGNYGGMRGMWDSLWNGRNDVRNNNGCRAVTKHSWNNIRKK